MKELLNNRKLVGFYILWLNIHFIILIISLSSSSSFERAIGGNCLWMINCDSLSPIATYDFYEFVFYAITPVGLLVCVNLLLPKK